MKKLLALAALGAALLAAGLLLSGTVFQPDYDGSRLGNDSELALDYQAFNRADSQTLTLAAGDTLDVDISNARGTVDLTVQKDGEEPIYEGAGLATLSFTLGVHEAGGYTVTVTGHRARGSVHIVRAPGA